MIEGELNDPFSEFFVEDVQLISASNSYAAIEGGDDISRKFWTEKYRLNHILIPNGLLTYDLARKILLTGKAVNFIRRCCQERDWALTAALVGGQQFFDSLLHINNYKDHSQGGAGGDNEEAQAGLRRWVDHAYEATNKELLRILF